MTLTNTKLSTKCSCSTAVYQMWWDDLSCVPAAHTSMHSIPLSRVEERRRWEGWWARAGSVLSGACSPCGVPSLAEAQGWPGQGSSRLSSQSPQPCCSHSMFLWLVQRLSTSLTAEPTTSEKGMWNQIWLFFVLNNSISAFYVLYCCKDAFRSLPVWIATAPSERWQK